MDREELEARLREAGVVDTAAWPLGSTIRVKDSSAETMQAPTSSEVRALPRLSVDLRASIGAPGSEPIARPGADLEVRALIGEGGMGRVFLARQHSLRRDVAVKTAKDGSPDAVRQAILVEGAITGQLEHPAIVPVHALGIDSEGRPAMVMKRIEGVTWGVLAGDPTHEGWDGWEGTAEDRLPGHLQILVQICNALHFAHSRGIVHRDIKLENVLIGRFGDVYLADWGIATEIGKGGGKICGTPGYLAPEMVDARPPDERTDVYLLGATMHEILTGEMRHTATTALHAILQAKLSEPHEFGPDVPQELADLVNQACHVEPDERPADAWVFRDAVLEHVRHRESTALAAEGAQRVEQLERLHADADPDEQKRRDIDRVVAEARFGLDTALSQWPENAVAREARERLEALLQARRDRAAELERDAYQRDPRVAVRVRAIGLTAVGVIGLLMAYAIVFVVERPSKTQLVVFPLFMAGLIGIGAFVLRKRVLITRFNRENLAVVLFLLGLMSVGRLLGFAADIELAEHFVRDSFLLAGGAGVVAIAYLRWVGWLALLFLISAVLCSTMPEHALITFGLSTAFAILFAAAAQWRSVE